MYDFEATLAILLQNPATPDGVSEAIAQLRGDQEKADPEEGKAHGAGPKLAGGFALNRAGYDPAIAVGRVGASLSAQPIASPQASGGFGWQPARADLSLGRVIVCAADEGVTTAIALSGVSPLRRHLIGSAAI